MKISINKIRVELSMQAILENYGITSLQRKGDSLFGCCPIHHGDNPNAFHVNLKKNLWNCFTRHHGGDTLSFIMQYENVGFKEAAQIAERIISSSQNIKIKSQSGNSIDEFKSNSPLRFALNLNPNHKYLRQRGLTRDTIEYFGIGFCDSGIMKGKIAIPIHNENGSLLAYCGRSTNDEKPKYKFPKCFYKSLVLYNLHRIKSLNSSPLILVEGFFDVFKLHQAGFPNVIALMGSSLSQQQTELLLSLQKKLILLLDGDKAGRNCTEKIIKALKGRLPMAVKYLPDGVQPDNLKESDLINLLKERRD